MSDLISFFKSLSCADEDGVRGAAVAEADEAVEVRRAVETVEGRRVAEGVVAALLVVGDVRFAAEAVGDTRFTPGVAVAVLLAVVAVVRVRAAVELMAELAGVRAVVGLTDRAVAGVVPTAAGRLVAPALEIFAPAVVVVAGATRRFATVGAASGILPCVIEVKEYKKQKEKGKGKETEKWKKKKKVRIQG